MGMKFEDVVVDSFDVGPAPARLAVCECGGRTWVVYAVRLRSSHLHLQCAACGVSYCDGSCGADGACGDAGNWDTKLGS
jgi:hypothetical protein